MISAVFMMFAYGFRMNSLIFIIATIIYLIMNLINDFNKKEYKDNLVCIAVIILYVTISVFPTKLVQSYYLEKCNLDKSKVYPNESYFLMAMEESRRGNGWYNEEIAEYAIKNIEIVKEQYREKIKERINYFYKNFGYAFNFYTMKLVSMWTENTYSAINVNTVGGYEELENVHGLLQFYQKTLLIVICLSCLIVLIKNRKELSLDVIFLLTIFIGGFAFHILWEAKSRYIIPYIVVLIPIASINVKSFSVRKYKEGFMNFLKRLLNL